MVSLEVQGRKQLQVSLVKVLFFHLHGKTTKTPVTSYFFGWDSNKVSP